MTTVEAAELVAVLLGAYPSARVNEQTCKIYESMLKDLDRDSAARAVSRLLATSKFLPAIAEIRAEATTVEHGHRRLGGEAWGDVGLAVRRFGRYEHPVFDDQIVAECVRQMGWLSLCNSTNEVADRARFIELYDGLAQRDRRELVAGAANALPGKSSGGRRLESGRRDASALLGKIGNGGMR